MNGTGNIQVVCDFRAIKSPCLGCAKWKRYQKRKRQTYKPLPCLDTCKMLLGYLDIIGNPRQQKELFNRNYVFNVKTNFQKTKQCTPAQYLAASEFLREYKTSHRLTMAQISLKVGVSAMMLSSIYQQVCKTTNIDAYNAIMGLRE
jgi:hypothetical protein